MKAAMLTARGRTTTAMVAVGMRSYSSARKSSVLSVLLEAGKRSGVQLDLIEG